MRSYVGRILEDRGYAVRAVADGEAALAACRDGPRPDLILTDVMMPGALDGFALLRALRADPATETVSVVLLSARAGEEARVEGLAAGADDYMVKPFGARELMARVDGAIRLARMRRQAARREQELAAARAEARLRLAMDAAKMGEVVFDLTDGVIAHSPGYALLLGFPADRTLSLEDIVGRYQPDYRDDVLARRTAPSAPDGVFEVEHQILRLDGASRWLAGRGEVRRNAEGETTEILSVYTDVTARRLADDHQKLMLDELNHRVKNTLATVQSIASQTRRNAETPAEFGATLEARIQALAGAHDLLTRTSWEGASLADVVGLTLAPHMTADDDGRPNISAHGPAIRLSPNAAISLNMGFHELATNASKYGALSCKDGRLDLQWSVDRSFDPPMIRIEWSERGGPPVALPRRQGFGTRLVGSSLGPALDGEVSLVYEPEGVRCIFNLPASARVSPG